MKERKKIPQTDSIQELAHFWDTHDLTDFEDDLEEVFEPVFEPQTEIVVPLQPEELEVLRTLANARATSPMNLIREWVLERMETSSEAG